VFVLANSLFEFAQRCGLNPPLDPQTAGLSIEGRAVPDYGAPFIFPSSAGILPAVFIFEKSEAEPARRRRYQDRPAFLCFP
jgi:hypothetical protein